MTDGPRGFGERRGLKPRGRFDIQASMTMTALLDDSITRLLTRIRGEFPEMPGLRLTSAQAARLWLSIVERRNGFSTVSRQQGFS